MKVSKILDDLSLCKDVINVLEIRFKNGELEEDDLKEGLSKVNRYLDIIEKDVENM